MVLVDALAVRTLRLRLRKHDRGLVDALAVRALLVLVDALAVRTVLLLHLQERLLRTLEIPLEGVDVRLQLPERRERPEAQAQGLLLGGRHLHGRSRGEEREHHHAASALLLLKTDTRDPRRAVLEP